MIKKYKAKQRITRLIRLLGGKNEVSRVLGKCPRSVYYYATGERDVDYALSCLIDSELEKAALKER